MRVPADLDHPYWVEDAEFDLEYHVRHIALPKPGDWRQFCIQAAPAARPSARPVEAALGAVRDRGPRQRSRACPTGAFAFVLKVHHAAVDGKSGVEMITAIHSQSRRGRRPATAGDAVAARTPIPRR